MTLPLPPSCNSAWRRWISELSDDRVKVDRTTYNAARIWKLYGTLVCKGDSTPDRPHRLARWLEVPAPLEIVTHDHLAQLAAMVPPASPTRAAPHASAGQPFDVEAWIATHQLPVVQQKPWRDGHIWILNPCPWNPAHTNGAARIVRLANGAISAGCFHNSCAGKDWHALRDLVEPGWRDARRTRALPEAIEQLLTTLKEDREPGPVFDAVDALAALSKTQWGKLKAELKDILGAKLNLPDLERAVTEARQQATEAPSLAETDGLPDIQVNDRPLRAITADACGGYGPGQHPSHRLSP